MVIPNGRVTWNRKLRNGITFVEVQSQIKIKVGGHKFRVPGRRVTTNSDNAAFHILSLEIVG